MSPKDTKPFRYNWWSKAKEEWTPKLLIENRKNWPLEVDYRGKPWKALSSAYASWKSKTFGNLPILRITGRMLDTASIDNRGNKFFVRTNQIGVYHQFGTKAMPARPWMGIPDTSLIDLSRIAIKHILK